jgi:hypothetical protein
MRTTIECHPSGTYFDFADPRPEMVHVEDIARALSQTCRFGGHTKRFYAVAEHALLVHRLVRDVAGPELAFAALHHDSHEAYTGDVPTPLKDLIKARAPDVWDTLTNAIDCAIESRFGIFYAGSLFQHDIIKAADAQALAIEAGFLKVSRCIGAHWPSTHTSVPEMPTGADRHCETTWAEGMFLAAHRRALAEVRVAA